MGCHCKYWKDERGKNSPDKRAAADRRRLQDDVHEMVCEAHGDLWFSCVCPACDAVLMDEEFFGVAS
jgi:hypothetical protein